MTAFSYWNCTVRWRGLPRNRTVVSWRLDSERSWRGFWDLVCAVFEVLVFLYLTHMGWQPFIYPGLWKFQLVFCNIFRSVSLDVLVLVFYSVFYICAIVCLIFIAHAEYHRTYCMWDWEEVTFPNYPSSTVCLGLLRKLWCWFFLPALRHTSIDYFVWEHVVCWGVGTLCGDCSTSVGSRGCQSTADVLLVVYTSSAFLVPGLFTHLCFSHHLESPSRSVVTCHRVSEVGIVPLHRLTWRLPQGPVSNALGFPPLVKRISSCQGLCLSSLVSLVLWIVYLLQ
jgi:hypothetical protein